MVTKVKTHLQEHKETYIAIGATAVVMGGTGLVLGAKKADVLTQAKFTQVGFFWKSPPTNKFISTVTVQKAARGPLGNGVVRDSDGQGYRSMRNAALENKMSEYAMRKSLQTGSPAPDGNTYHVEKEAVWADPSQN